jgi:hypothetical protein
MRPTTAPRRISPFASARSGRSAEDLYKHANKLRFVRIGGEVDVGGLARARSEVAHGSPGGQLGIYLDIDRDELGRQDRRVDDGADGESVVDGGRP